LDMSRQTKFSTLEAQGNGIAAEQRYLDSIRMGTATRGTVEQGSTISIEWLASGGMFARHCDAHIVAAGVERTRTVWNTVSNAGENWPKTTVPKYYTYTQGTRGTQVFVTANATEHIAERAVGFIQRNPYNVNAVEQSLLASQVQMESLHASIDIVT